MAIPRPRSATLLWNASSGPIWQGVRRRGPSPHPSAPLPPSPQPGDPTLEDLPFRLQPQKPLLGFRRLSLGRGQVDVLPCSRRAASLPNRLCGSQGKPWGSRRRAQVLLRPHRGLESLADGVGIVLRPELVHADLVRGIAAAQPGARRPAPVSLLLSLLSFPSSSPLLFLLLLLLLIPPSVNSFSFSNPFLTLELRGPGLVAGRDFLPAAPGPRPAAAAPSTQ